MVMNDPPAEDLLLAARLSPAEAAAAWPAPAASTASSALASRRLHTESPAETPQQRLKDSTSSAPKRAGPADSAARKSKKKPRNKSKRPRMTAKVLREIQAHISTLALMRLYEPGRTLKKKDLEKKLDELYHGDSAGEFVSTRQSSSPPSVSYAP